MDKAFFQGAVMAGEGNMNPEGKVEKAFPRRNLYASLQMIAPLFYILCPQHTVLTALRHVPTFWVAKSYQL